MKISIDVKGLEDVGRVLKEAGPREARNLIRSTVYDMAGQGAQIAGALAPNDPSTAGGDLRSSIKPKRERGTPNRIEATVVVTNLKRNYFWRFLEYGQGPDHVQHAFFGRAFAFLREHMETILLTTFVRKLEARLARLRRGAGR